VSDEYSAHVQREELRYLLAYEEWEKNLSPEERVMLNGASAPNIEDHQSHNTKRIVLGVAADVAESPLASVTPRVAEAIDTPADELQDLFGLDAVTAARVALWAEKRIEVEAERRKAMVVARVVGNFMHTSNAKLLSASLAFAADMALEFGIGTMQDWASQNGLSRQAVSKVAKKWQEELELPVSRSMRKQEVCQSCSKAQKERHWRKRLPRITEGKTVGQSAISHGDSEDSGQVAGDERVA
jgi:hypothetical protein